MLNNIFSVKNEKYHRIITIFGFKVKIRSQMLQEIYKQKKKYKRLQKNLKQQKKELTTIMKDMELSFNQELKKQASDEYYNIRSIARFDGVTDELMCRLKYLEQSKYNWMYCRKEIWLIYIMCLIHLKETESAIKVLRKYNYFHEEKLIHKYFTVSKLAYENGITNELIEKSAICCYELEKNKNTLKDFLVEKSIAIVGNGPCEIGLGKGEEIDSHDVVIRFNNFQIKGYETDYGKKTDIWCCNLNSDIEIKNDNFKLILLPESIALRSCSKYKIFHEAIKNNIPICCFNEEQTYGLTKDVFYSPTFGYRLIYGLNYILGSLDNVDFYGFNFLKEEKDNYTCHYFNSEGPSEEKHVKTHDLLDETEEIIKFINAHRSINV